MKTLMIACSLVALAGMAGIATSQKAEAGFFGPQTVSGCHKVATHLPRVPWVWKCKVDSLPSWWNRPDYIPMPGGAGLPAANKAAPPPLAGLAERCRLKRIGAACYRSPRAAFRARKHDA